MKFAYAYVKNIVCLSVMALFFAMASYCHADSASVQIKGLAEGEVNVVIRNISNNQPAQDGLITWSNVSAGQTGWKAANQYIEISHTDLPEFWGMQLYTDNKNVSADPRYTGTADPAGLVKTDNTIFSLPMAWRIADGVIANPGNPVQRQDGNGFDDYMWHFLKDKNTPDNPLTNRDESFSNADEYVTIWNQAGIAWNEGGRSGNPKKAYIYLAANFTMSSVGSLYRTNALTIEAYEGVSPFPIYLYKDAPLTEYLNEPGATLENHFAPSGWMGGSFSVDPKCREVTPYSGRHCFKINWSGSGGWGGIMWLEPHNVWDYGAGHPTHKGYDLRGSDYLSFWARTTAQNSGMKIKVYYGNTWDSCGQTSQLWRTPPLTPQWQQYTIPVLDRDMSNVTGGLAVVFDAANTPNHHNGAVIYLDEIKFDRY